MFGFLSNPEYQIVMQLFAASAVLACIVWVVALLGFGWLLMGRLGGNTLPTVAALAGGFIALLSFSLFGDLLLAILRQVSPSWHKTALMVMQFGSIALLLVVFVVAATSETALMDALRRRKGAAGEKLVAKRLKTLGYEHLNNRYVGDARDVAQVDHIACVGGVVLVIETKHLEGKLYPQADGTLQQFFDDDKKPTTVRDPVRQNARQVGAVERFADGIGVMGVIVFIDRSEFPKGLPAGCVRLKDLGPYLRFVASSSPATDETAKAWAELRSRIEALNQGDLGKRHIEMLADNSAFQSLPEGVTVCRKCQGHNVRAEFVYSYHWRCADCGGRSAMKVHEAEAMGISLDQIGAAGGYEGGRLGTYRQPDYGLKRGSPVGPLPRASDYGRLPEKPQNKA